LGAFWPIVMPVVLLLVFATTAPPPPEPIGVLPPLATGSIIR
jgi:hypothetical protein